MRYAKLTRDGIQYAPRAITVGQTHYNPAPVDMLERMGYLPVMDKPYPDDGRFYAGGWAAVEGQIVRVWTETEPPLDETEPAIGPVF